MAAPVPPGAPRASNTAAPPPNYNPNYQRHPDSLAENMQNLQINRPPSGPRPPPPSYMQSPPSHTSAPYSAPQHSVPFPGAVPVSRPGPSPGPQSGVPARPGIVPTGPPQSTFPQNMPPGRPSAYPINQAPPFGSRPSAGSFPSPMASQVTTPSGAPPVAFTSSPAAPPSAFPAPGFSNNPSIPPVAARPGAFVSSPLSTGPIMPPSGASGGPISNGPPMFASGASQGGPRYPLADNTMQPPVGPPPTMISTQAHSQPPTMRTLLGNTAPNVPPGPPVQTTPAGVPFSAATQGVPPPPGSPYSLQTWPMQPRQVSF